MMGLGLSCIRLLFQAHMLLHAEDTRFFVNLFDVIIGNLLFQILSGVSGTRIFVRHKLPI